MGIQSDQREERRLEKLAALERSVKDGSLRIRVMTPEERLRYPVLPAKARRK